MGSGLFGYRIFTFQNDESQRYVSVIEHSGDSAESNTLDSIKITISFIGSPVKKTYCSVLRLGARNQIGQQLWQQY